MYVELRYALEIMVHTPTLVTTPIQLTFNSQVLAILVQYTGTVAHNICTTFSIPSQETGLGNVSKMTYFVSSGT